MSRTKQQRNLILMANEFPEDLVTQILLCLPVVSLLRFKSVRKSWYALIEHQDFITKHLQHIKNRNSNTHLLLKLRDKTTKDYVVSTLSYETLQVSLTQPVPPQFFGIDKDETIFVGGSCNGLVCMYDCGASTALRVVIWNPATKETKVVPESNLPRFAPAGYITYSEGMGFGFDAKTNDYKIINLLITLDPYSYDIMYAPERVIHHKEVYSLSADSWKKVDGPPCFLDFRAPKTYINGMPSWTATGMPSWTATAEGRETFILSFDMSDEVFLKTPLPYDFRRECVFCTNFFASNESIAMVAAFRNTELGTIDRFDIWLLLEVGVQNSWTKPFTAGRELARLIPLGFWKNDNLFCEHLDGQPVLYDCFTKEIREITNLQIAKLSQSQLFIYMETLVSVKGGNEI